MPLSPGARLGREVVYAVVKQDLPVIIGGTIVASALVVAANLVVDACHAILDPRVRGGGEKAVPEPLAYRHSAFRSRVRCAIRE